MKEMDYKNAPNSHLDTWSFVVKLITYSTVGICGILALMAATLL